MQAWTPTRIWEGQDAYIIGGGSSLVGFDFFKLEGKNTIGVNDAYRLGPKIVQIVFFSDSAWFEKNKFELEKHPWTVVTCAPTLLDTRAPWLKPMHRVKEGLAHGSSLAWNYSSGAGAINLSISLGAKRVFLLGMDLAVNGNGKSHWHNLRPRAPSSDVFHLFRIGFQSVYRAIILQKIPVEVINVTNGISTVPNFERRTFEEVFGA